MAVGGWLLARDSARSLVRIGVDRVREAGGGALPRTREQLARPETLNALLATHAGEAGRAWPALRSVRLPGVDFESSNCTNFLVELDFEGGGEGLPDTAYAKLPCDALATRTFAGALGFWELECLFCLRIAPRVPIRVPGVYAAVHEGSRFVLLLENLEALPGAQLFINRDMAAGTTLERARRVLEMFAVLHAGFQGLDAAAREALLPVRHHTYLNPARRAVSLSMQSSAIEACHRKAPEVFDAELAATSRCAVQEKWQALGALWFDGPLTLIHGDSHLGNVFEYATPEGPRMGMLDFQAVQWSKGVRDVQYFLINSLDPDLLARHESSLIDHYLEASAREGVEHDAAETYRLYRAFSFQTLTTAVVSFGLGSLTERDGTLDAVLERSVAASRRLDFAGLLAEL